MKHNGFAEQMRQRLGNAEADVPEGLWDAIEQKLDAQPTAAPQMTIAKTPRRVVLRRWAVAASVAIVAGAGLWWYAHDDDTLPGGAKALGVVAYDNAEVKPAVSKGADRKGLSENSNLSVGSNSLNGSNVSVGSNHSGGSNPSSGSNATMVAQYMSRRADGGADMVAMVDNDSKAVVAQTFTDESGNGVAPSKDVTDQEAKAEAKRGLKEGSMATARSMTNRRTQTTATGRSAATAMERSATTAMRRSAATEEQFSRRAGNGGSKWQFGVGTSGNMTRYSSTNGIMPVRYSDVAMAQGSNNAYFSAEPLQRDCKETTKHNMPVSFGATVSYDLNDRLALTSGLVYTLATSSFEHGTSSNASKDEQTLHYVGIPLTASYTIWGNSWLKTYVNAGGQADFNVSAKVETEGHTADIDKDRAQLSVGAAAGVQLNVIKQMGVYVEPGVRYYFDNGSNVQTVFKEHPCNFSLQMGLRWNF